MSSLLIKLLCCLTLLLLPSAITAFDLGVAYYTCLHNATTSAGGPNPTFQHNLEAALQRLTSLSSKGTKYAIASEGSGEDKAYAMFQCRGDQSVKGCSACINNATLLLPQRYCPFSIGARIQLDPCYLRYNNQPFFTPDFEYVIGYCYAKTSDVTALTAIEELMANVTSLAPKNGGYASASASGEYALAQCLGYLTQSQCQECLSKYSYRVICDSTLGEQLHLTSCFYRYEPYSFFTPSPPPPPSH